MKTHNPYLDLARTAQYRDLTNLIYEITRFRQWCVLENSTKILILTLDSQYGGKILGWNMDFEKLDSWEKPRLFEKPLGLASKGAAGAMPAGGSGEKKLFFLVSTGRRLRSLTEPRWSERASEWDQERASSPTCPRRRRHPPRDPALSHWLPLAMPHPWNS